MRPLFVYSFTVLIAQIMHRLGLNWRAVPAHSPGEAGRTFQTIVFTFFFITILNIVAVAVIEEFDSDEEVELHSRSTAHVVTGILRAIDAVFSLYLLFITVKTRYYIRQTYQIPDHCDACPDCMEDYCIVNYCKCCALSQMARHVADYDSYSASYCTETGVRGDVEATERHLPGKQFGATMV